MSEATAEFFDWINRDGRRPSAKKGRGTIRFDITDGQRTEHWSLVVQDGDVEVYREHREADCVLRADEEAFCRLAAGHDSVFAALLRNRISVEGDLRLLTPIRELLPAAPGSHHPAERVGRPGRPS